MDKKFDWPRGVFVALIAGVAVFLWAFLLVRKPIGYALASAAIWGTFFGLMAARRWL